MPCREDVLFSSRACRSVRAAAGDDGEADEPQVLPFIPWPHQVEAIKYADQWMVADIRVNKSRARGVLPVLDDVPARATIPAMFKVNIVSKDRTRRATAPRPGFDHVEDHVRWLESLPWWMRGEPKVDWVQRDRPHAEQQAERVGDSGLRLHGQRGQQRPGGGVLYGRDRQVPRAYDGDAVTAHSSRSPAAGSSAARPTGAASLRRLMHDPTARDPIQKLSWMDNPTQNRAMYHVMHGRRVLAVEPGKYGKLPKQYLDAVWWGDLKRRLEDRGFELSKGYRSPWYDNENCLRPGTFTCRSLGAGHVLHGGHGGTSRTLWSISCAGHGQAAGGAGRVELHDGRLQAAVAGDAGRPVPVVVPAGAGRVRPAGPVRGLGRHRHGAGRRRLGGDRLEPAYASQGGVVRGAEHAAVLVYRDGDRGLLVVQDDRRGPAFLAWEANGPGQEFQKRVLETDFQDPAQYADVVTKRATNKPGYWTRAFGAAGPMLREAARWRPVREPGRGGGWRSCGSTASAWTGSRSGARGEPEGGPTGARRRTPTSVVADAVGWIAALDFGRVSGGTVREAMNVMNVTPGNARWARMRGAGRSWRG